MRTHATFRLTDADLAYFDAVAETLARTLAGVSVTRTDLVRYAVRQVGERLGVPQVVAAKLEKTSRKARRKP